MRTILALFLCAALAGCALVTLPETEPSWADARMAEDPGREAPAFVPDIARPDYESWRMASAAHDLADTRDQVISRAQLIMLPPIDSLTFGERAREQATPPPLPARRD